LFDEALELKMGWTIGPQVLETGMLASEEEEEEASAAGAVGWGSKIREWCDWCEL
jgi:hypothetical protein